MGIGGLFEACLDISDWVGFFNEFLVVLGGSCLVETCLAVSVWVCGFKEFLVIFWGIGLFESWLDVSIWTWGLKEFLEVLGGTCLLVGCLPVLDCFCCFKEASWVCWRWDGSDISDGTWVLLGRNLSALEWVGYFEWVSLIFELIILCVRWFEEGDWEFFFIGSSKAFVLEGFFILGLSLLDWTCCFKESTLVLTKIGWLFDASGCNCCFEEISRAFGEQAYW